MIKEETQSQRGRASSTISDTEETNLHKHNSTNTISKPFMSQLKAQGGLSNMGKVQNRRGSDNRVHMTRILLTGGPCAGKTTAMASISQDLTQLGYKVLIVPEAATLIMKGGAMIVSAAFTPDQGLMFQKALMKLQIALEDCYCEIG